MKSKLVIRDSHLLFSSTRYPPIRAQHLPEMAIFGRSNVGKSTLVNQLVGNKKLARTSGTPGCTKDLNFYYVDGSLDERSFTLCLVDVPGFGYAKFAKEQRERLNRTVVDFVATSELLEIVVILNDCRRQPEVDELALRDVAARAERRVLVALTKCDKMSKNELSKAAKEISSHYSLEKDDILMIGKGFDSNVLWQRVLELME